jgi:multiple sugar transport system substrate-binding protein
MKKLIFVSALVFMIGLSAFASGQTDESGAVSEKKAEILLWLPPFGTGDSLDSEFWTNTIQPWADENNVAVSIEITPWGGYEEKYLTGFAAGQGPDVGYMYLEMFSDFIEMDTLEDIDSYFTSQEKANYIHWEKGHMKGGQYALPFIVGNARVPHFNMDILEKAGVQSVPTNWEELIAASIKIKEANLDNVIPFAQEWGHASIGALNNLFYPYLWQAGGNIYDEEGKSVALLDNDAAVRVAQLLYDLRFEHNIIPDESLSMDGKTLINEFIAGRIGIASIQTKSSKRIDEAGFNWDFIPSFEDKKKAIWIASDSLIMNKTCENKELAAKLMKYITSAEVMSQFHTQISAFPPITNDEEYNDNIIFKDMYENNTEDFHTLPVADGAFKVMDILYKNLQLMMLGDLSPEEAITNTVDYSHSVLDTK